MKIKLIESNSVISLILARYKIIVFDLDDTLYSEKEYLFSAYDEIARYLAGQYNLPFPEINSFLQKVFCDEGRENIFNKLIKYYQIPSTVIDKLLHLLRHHKPKNGLHFDPKMLEFVNLCIEKKKLVVVLTNGNKIQQQNKVNLLNQSLSTQTIKYYFAADYGMKPSPEGLNNIVRDFAVTKSEVIFIGDNSIDELTARNAKIDFYYCNSLTI